MIKSFHLVSKTHLPNARKYSIIVGMKQTVTLCVTCAFGIEAITMRELNRLGFLDVKAENGKIVFPARVQDIALLNLYLRTANKVFIVLGNFTATTFDELFEGVKAIPLEDYIPWNAQMPVSGKKRAVCVFCLPKNHQKSHLCATYGKNGEKSSSRNGRAVRY